MKKKEFMIAIITARPPGTASHSNMIIALIDLTDEEVHPAVVHCRLISVVLSNQVGGYEPMLKGLLEELSIFKCSLLGVEHRQLH